MKIIDLYNKIANDEEVPYKLKYNGEIYEYVKEMKWYLRNDLKCELYNGKKSLNDEVEILDDEIKKFTKEDFIKERIDLDGITREQFDERYEVKECNCGMPYCKGFRAIEKKEKESPEKLDKYVDVSGDLACEWSFAEKKLKDKINEIIDYLEKQRKGE